MKYFSVIALVTTLLLNARQQTSQIVFTQRASSETSFEVTHYQFVDWPDHSVPECAGELLSFLRKAMATENSTPDNDAAEGSILVHCR